MVLINFWGENGKYSVLFGFIFFECVSINVSVYNIIFGFNIAKSKSAFNKMNVLQ